MPHEPETCEICRYFVGDTQAAARSDGRYQGACHRYAPRPEGAHVLPWPLVREVDWCGEWERAAPPPLPEPEPPKPPGQAVSVELVAGTPRPQ